MLSIVGLATLAGVGVIVVRSSPHARSLSVNRVLADLPSDPSSSTVANPGIEPPSWTWSANEAIALRDLVLFERYDSAERVLRRVRDEARSDPRAEGRYYDAYASFWEGTLGPVLDGWVAARPASGEARMARATHLVDMAFKRRGGALARNTSDDQWAAMNAALDSALRDVHAALTRDPADLAGYWVLLRAAQTPAPTAAALAPALRLSPASMTTRVRAMLNFRPRWGGTYELMTQLADDAQLYVGQVPELSALRGFVAWDLADVAQRQNDTEAMLRHLTASLAHGESYPLCLDAARMLRREERLAEALRHAECATRLRPSIAEGHLALARVLYARAREGYPATWSEFYPRARDEAYLAFQLDSLDQQIADFWRLASDPFSKSRARNQE